MTRETAIARYLAKRADPERRLVAACPLDGIDQVAVIPLFAERAVFEHTLKSLAANPASMLARTLILCVVNNPADADAQTREDNESTLERIAFLQKADTPDTRWAQALKLAYADAASHGHELPKGGGVGRARKRGLDTALAVLPHSQSANRLLLCLDADTLVEPNYLQAVREHADQRGLWAGHVAFAHRLDDDATSAAIVCYELFLRYYVLGLRRAGSPYAFHSIGSTIVCSAQAYAAVSGMNTRAAGEDFYFLQKLAKTGRVEAINTTTVHPSSRASHRVPFGTGQRVRRFLEDSRGEYAVYHPDTFEVLRDWLAATHAAAQEDRTGAEVLAQARPIHPGLCAFLEQAGFVPAWDKLRENTRDGAHLAEQFTVWFDGFRTLKLVHHLRDTALPLQDVFAALPALLKRLGATPPIEPLLPERRDTASQARFLEHVRAVDRSPQNRGASAGGAS